MKTITAGFCAIFLSIFLLSDHTIAQNFKSRKLYKDAERAFSESNFTRSYHLCKDALNHSPGHAEVQFLLGRCYYQLKNPIEAEKQFLALLGNEDFSLQSKYWLALSYKMQGKYTEAIEYFDEFLAEHVGKNVQTAKAVIEKEGAVLAKGKTEDLIDKFEFENAGPRINSDESEYSVAFADGQNKLIVNYLYAEGTNGENLKFEFAQGWMRISENDEFDFLNTPDWEGPGSMDNKGETFYFTHCKEPENQCRIMVSKKKDGIWLKASPLPQHINMPETNTSDPFISYDGDTLFFVSDRRGGMGGSDIWFTVKAENNSWSDPMNLGQPINTPYEEGSPFLSREGTFYFASDGHPGWGGKDIFYTQHLNGKRQIMNAGSPFNSSYDDHHLVVNETAGFVSSDRPGGYGLFDIYTFANNRKDKEGSEALSAVDETVYSSLFASQLYGIESKFLGSDVETFVELNKSQKKELRKEISEKISSMSLEEKDQIKKEDKILYASLSREKRFFVDRLTASYFESESESLKISEEDYRWFTAMEIPEQRKLYRLMASNVHEIQQEFISQNTPLIVDADDKTSADEGDLLTEEAINRVNQKPTISLVQDYEGQSYAHAVTTVEKEVVVKPEETEPHSEIERITDQAKLAPEPAIVPPSLVRPTPPTHSISSPEQESALDFYQRLPFTDRKRIDRIIALKLVNEMYILTPGLSVFDDKYYHVLPANEKEIVDRLQLYFRAWDDAQESASLMESDLQYLSSLPEEKQQVIKRLIVRKGIGVDAENMIRFESADWERYKKFSANDIDNIKEVARLLKNHQQVFDIALAYAGENYTFNNDLALRRMAENKPVLLASSDPEMVIEGMEHTYESVYFDRGNYELRKETKAALNDVVELYFQNPEIRINLLANSSDLSSNRENLQLSDLRASAAKNYLEASGIPAYKIQLESHANLSPIEEIDGIESLKSRKLDIRILNSPQVFESENTTYLVQPGNTLYSLSKANGISVEELMAMNGLTDYTIMAYQPLRVKKEATLDPHLMMEPSTHLLYAGTESRPSADGSNEPADTEKDIESAERGDDIMVIEVNEVPKSTTVFHVVKRGEKLRQIAEIYGVDEKEIMRLNKMKKRRVKAGEKLVIKN